MSYNIDMLKFRKNAVKQPLQICFCAATTKNFVGNDTHKVTKQEVEDVDIAAACDAIMDGLSSSENTPRMSLHMSSQLMFGALRVFKEQVLSAEEFSENLVSAVITNCDIEAEPKVAKKTKRINKKDTKTNEQFSDPVLPDSVSDIDIINLLSKDLHEDLHLIDEIDTYRPPSQSQSFGFSPDDVDDIDLVTRELQRTLMRGQEQHLEHSMSAFNVQQDEEAQEEVGTLPLPFENGNATDSMKTDAPSKLIQPQNIPNKRGKSDCPLDGLPPTQLSSSSEIASTAYSPAARTKRTLPLEGDHFGRSTPSTRVTGTGEVAPLLQPIDTADIEMSGSQTGRQPPVVAPQIMDNESAIPALPDNAMEVNVESDISGIHCTPVVVNQPITKGKSKKKKITVDRKKELNLTKEPGPQIFTEPLRKVISEPLNILFKLPTTLKRKIFHNDGRSWARCLIKMYEENVQKPYQNFVELDNFNNNQDELREESAQPMEAHRVKLSPVKIILKDLRVVLRRVQLPNESNVPPEDNLPSLVRQTSKLPNSGMQFDETMDINSRSGDDDEPEGPVDNISIGAPMVKKFKSSFLRSMESSDEEVVLKVFLRQSEFFDLIQRHWKKIEGHRNKDKEVNVMFDEVVNHDNIHIQQVIRYLIYCFDLEKNGQLYLKQETPFATLYIIKPPDKL